MGLQQRPHVKYFGSNTMNRKYRLRKMFPVKSNTLLHCLPSHVFNAAWFSKDGVVCPGRVSKLEGMIIFGGVPVGDDTLGSAAESGVGLFFGVLPWGGGVVCVEYSSRGVNFFAYSHR